MKSEETGSKRQIQNTSRLDHKATTEIGYNRDEALRCAKAVRAFQETFKPKSLSRCKISPSPRMISKSISGVRVNVSIDATVTETKGDTTCSGGVVLLYAFSADRGSLKERLSAVAGLILWTLEGGQMQPLP